MTRKFGFIILFFFFLKNFAIAEDKIAFIDLNYIFNKSTAGKQINDEIKNKSEKLNNDFKKYQQNINEEKNKLIAQQNVLDKDEYEKKLKNLQKNLNEYNGTISKKQNELQQYRVKAKSEFSKELAIILQEYSKDNSIGIILRKENLLIGRNNLDITANIFELFNKKVKKISLK